MKKYTIYFEIYGKKFKTTILAKNKGDAWLAVQSKLTCIKIEEEKNDDNPFMDVLNNIFK
jgi:hypothetical protein